MGTSTKVVNYSPALTAKIVEAYAEAENDEQREQAVQDLSAETGKTVRSLRMKLVTEGVYIKPAYVSKTGAKAESKSAIVESIAALYNVTSEQLPGLDKATKKALTFIRSEIVAASETIEALQNPQAE